MPSNSESSDDEAPDSSNRVQRKSLRRSQNPQTPSRSHRTPNKSTNQTRTTPSGSAKRKTATPSRRQAPSTSRQTTQKRRYRPGTKALKEIRDLQRSTNLCIRKLPFSRLVREIQHRQNPRVTHWCTTALTALQEAAEAYLVRFLEDCNEAAMFSNRVTIMQKDFQFINKLRGRSGII